MEYSFNSSKIKKLLDAEKKDFKRINLHTSLRDKVQSMIKGYSNNLYYQFQK